MFDRIIKQVTVVDPDDVVHIPGEEEPRTPARRRADGKEPAGGDDLPDEPTGEELRLARRIAEAQAAEKAAERRKEEMEQLSERILKSANEQSNQILADARQQAEALRAEAREQGYAEALNQTGGELRQTIDAVNDLMDQLSRRQQKFFEEYSDELEDLAITVAEKLLARTIEADHTQMADLVMQAVMSLKTDGWITVELSDKMTGLMEHIQQQYAAYLSRRPVEFTAKELPAGSCTVQTATGITDASIATQLGNLRGMLHPKQ